MNMGIGYYIVIVALIGACVGYLVYTKKKAQAADNAKRPPQKGIIK